MTAAIAVELTAVQLQRLAPGLTFDQLALYPVHLARAAGEWHIAERTERLAAWLGQLLHESAELRHWVESFAYSAERLQAVFPRYFPTRALAQWYVQAGQEHIASRVYADRMGNGNEHSQDGWEFRGRGPIQLTGRNNYRLAGEALSLPLEVEPEMASAPEHGFRIAAWFWSAPDAPRAGRARSLNVLADAHTVAAYREISYAINGYRNGEPHGWVSRLKHWRAACAVLGLPAPKES